MKKIIKNFNISIIKQSIALMGSQGKIYMLFIFGFCGIELCCTVLSTAGTKGVINAVEELNMNKFWLPMSYIIIKNLLWWIYAPISSYVTAKISKRTLCSIKTNLAEHIVRLPMRYHDNKPTGELLSVLSNDIRCLSGIYDWSLFQVLRSAIGGIGGVVVMTIIDWRFAIVVFSLGTISVYLSSYFSKKLEAAGQEQQEQLAKTSIDAYELVRAAKTIRLFHMEKHKETSFIKTLDKEAEVKRKSGKISARMNSTITMVNLLSYAAILFIGALFVYWNLTDWGTVIALLGLKEITDMLFVEFGQFMAEMQSSVAGAKRIFEIMDSREEETNNIYASSSNMETALSMENIDFAYDGANAVLSNFDLSLKSRGLTVLAGESGAGKSTIMKLILGLYAPDKGRISFYNSEGKYKSLREAAAYVPQEPMLFQGTIYDNIALGNPEAGDEMIIAAAKLAGADEFITKLSGGYAAEVLDNGISLSGGQKQRIAIARALLKNSEILLLDEITSGLDHETEEGIISTIKNISKNRAVLFITHNAEIIKQADEVKRVTYASIAGQTCIC